MSDLTMHYEIIVILVSTHCNQPWRSLTAHQTHFHIKRTEYISPLRSNRHILHFSSVTITPPQPQRNKFHDTSFSLNKQLKKSIKSTKELFGNAHFSIQDVNNLEILIIYITKIICAKHQTHVHQKFHSEKCIYKLMICITK